MPLRRISGTAVLLTPLFASMLLAPAPAAAQWTFTDVTAAAGITGTHAMDNTNTAARRTAGGAACGDYDNDGWVDLYYLAGNNGTNALYRNNGDGTFSDVAAAAGLAQSGTIGAGATFADWDGDGWLDLVTGGIEATNRKLFRNNGDGTFSDATMASGVWITSDTWSTTFGDIDNDNDLDMLMAHWNTSEGPGHIWRNDGAGVFAEVDSLVGFLGYGDGAGTDYTFTFNVTDIDSDGWMDLLVASDFNTSQVWTNDGDGTFTETTDSLVITDDNGMGAAVADYDRDGDLDWFVTSIWDGTTAHTGNRMYRNDGTGVFEDVTDSTGVRDGQFGWAATFQDLNNDGWLDIYHVNGWPTPNFLFDVSRCFVSDGDGTFTEMAATLGVDTSGQGRGVSAFDYDRDGDIDLFVANNSGPCVLYRNDGGNMDNWLQVKLQGQSPNTEGIGARITATVGGQSQLWEMRCGSNFLSQDPAEAHFGLGTDTIVDELVVDWPAGGTTTLTNVAANQRLVIPEGAVDAPVISPPDGAAMALWAAPNPFRTGTTIHFSLGDAAETSVRMFDSAGRAVRSLDGGLRAAGEHSVAWDGRDARGNRVAAGVYFYEVRTDAARARGRVVLLR